MANRVVFGKRNPGEYGLWISKPGFNVMTAGINNMLFWPDQDSLQFVQTGAVQVTNGNPVNIVIPNLGYWPMIFLAPNDEFGPFPGSGATDADWNPSITYNSNTSITIDINGPHSGSVVYVVMRLRADG